MMAEYPSDDVEAFNHSGERVFDIRRVQQLREGCRAPECVGDICGRATTGRESLIDVRFVDEVQGKLQIWAHPDNDSDITRRYVVVVDIGGRSVTADYSVIAVFDRYWQMYGGAPEIVAQWRGHIDHDLLAWKAAQIATYYHNALLVIESNTLETEHTDGEHTEYILDTIADAYTHLYARTSAETIRSSSTTRYRCFVSRDISSVT